MKTITILYYQDKTIVLIIINISSSHLRFDFHWCQFKWTNFKKKTSQVDMILTNEKESLILQLRMEESITLHLKMN
jgi:hypothetical protein